VKDEYTANAWCYVGVNTAGSIRLLGNNAPDYHDTSANTAGTKYYWKSGTTYWRVIGAVSLDTAEAIATPFKQYGDTVLHSIPKSLTTTVSASAWTTLAVPMPSFSEKGIFGLYAADDNDQFSGVWVRPTGTAWTTSIGNGVYVASAAANSAIGGQRQGMTDTSQQIDYYNHAGDSNTEIFLEGYDVSGIR
jgi:hypothetical protein